jgi:hypothetical protein
MKYALPTVGEKHVCPVHQVGPTVGSARGCTVVTSSKPAAPIESKCLTNTPVRMAGSVLKCSDDCRWKDRGGGRAANNRRR